MAHHVEPMDIDDIEGHFDNKENTYHHSNVQTRTPCTEKGYEELDVSELNMKLRYSMTPAASPMSKSMSHCLDNKYNASTDESLNNTVICENNLTRSLNSALCNTDPKSPKILPFQALSAELVDSNRNSTVLQPLDTTINKKDITITVSNENEIDNLSFPSSSSSMAHTPEATTPTKEVNKNDGGSPIMRGLKSVLSIFRSSQSPIPPGEGEVKAVESVLNPVVPLPDSKSQAIASTPINQKIKERSLSRNSPHKDSIVFKEDLEKELQWNDDSIVFSTEKVSIHKLFFQDKPSRSESQKLFLPEKEEDVNSTLEYMDVSYNDLSIRDSTLNGTVNKSKVHEIAESDGEFVDCETTFTQNESVSNSEEIIDQRIGDAMCRAPESDLIENNTVVNEQSMLYLTQDILRLLGSSEIVEDTGVVAKHDFSTTDIVNQLSDLIEASENIKTNVTNIDKCNVNSGDTEAQNTINVPKKTVVQPEVIDYQTISPEKPANIENIICSTVAENVSIEIYGKPKEILNVVSETVDNHVLSEVGSIPATAISLIVHEVISHVPKENETQTNNVFDEIFPLPVDIPLPDEDDFNSINDNFLEENQYAELQDKTMPVVETSQSLLMASLDKITAEATTGIQIIQNKTDNINVKAPGQPSLLSSNVSLPNTDENHSIKNTNLPHEARTADPELALPQTSKIPIVYSVDNVLICNSMDHIQVNSNAMTENALKPDLIQPVQEKMEMSFAELITEILPETQVMDVSNKLCAVSDELESNINTENNFVYVQQSQEDNQPLTNEAELTENYACKHNNAITENALTPDLIQAAEEKMEMSFAEQKPEILPETQAMDISNKVCAVSDEFESNIDTENTFAYVQQSQEDNQPLTIAAELPEVQTQNKEVDIIVDSLNAENHIKEVIVNSVSDTLTDGALTVHDALETSEDLKNIATVENKSDNTPNSGNSNVCEYVDSLLNPNKLDTITSSGFEFPQSLPNLPETSLVEQKSSDFWNSNDAEIVKDSDNLAVENLNVTSTNVNVTSPSTNAQSLDVLISTKMSITETKSDESVIINDSQITDFPKILDTTNNLDTKNHIEKPAIFIKNIDDEIVASESNNSTLVSMSAEDECQMKNEYPETSENPGSNNDQIYPLPPVSPKIVSKGYNFNFDDIDNINPFATKEKIRMSPPPDSCLNASLETMFKIKNDKVIPLNRATNANIRKSMPVRKGPLKAKKDFNSTFDSTDTAPAKQSEQKRDDNSGATKTDSDMQANSQILSENVQADIVQAISLSTQKVNQMFVTTQPGEITLDIPKAQAIHNVAKEDLTVKFGEVEDVIMSGRQKSPVKPDNTSSSEQSTYFSTGTSSTECESKNVFNLPEIDDKDFNPFATKSKIRQTPPPDLDMVNPFASNSKLKSSPETSFVITHTDANDTVTFDSDNTKKSEHNSSNCSGFSKTSDEKDATVQEVHTEDEDTIEGPFFEADDDGDKISEFGDGKGDMGEINNMKAQVNDDNTDAAEMFIDAEAFEFLMNQNKDDEVAYSGKESLFLKFDPLFARRVTSEGVAAALNEIQRRQCTPKKNPQPVLSKEDEFLSFDKIDANRSNLNVTHELQSFVNEGREDMNVTVTKPMMVVTPAVNPVVTPRHPSTPSRTNRLSMTFTSPAMAVIDRLLSLSGNSPSASLDATVTHVSREHNEADQALTQLRELLAEKEIHVYNLRCESKELKDRLTTIETQMKSLEAESAERLKKVNVLSESLVEKTKMNKSMAAVVEEYERTIASLISETEQDKKRYAEERSQLIRERDEQSAHLASMEVSFNDLHSKYEKSKQVIMGYKNNEDAYKSSLKEFEDNLAKMHTNYELLKQHATSKLNHANQELEKLNRGHEAEVLKFNAMIKRKDLHITSLEESLSQKTKANEELTAICDELINKVG